MRDDLDTAESGIALTVLATLGVEALVSQDDANAVGDVLAYSDEPTSPAVPFDEILKVDGSVDASVAEAIASNAQLVSPLIFSVNGVEVPQWRVLHERSRLDRSVDGITTFSFAMARRSTDREYDEPLGEIDDFCGSPPGLQSIDVDQIVFTDSQPRRIRLVTNGVVVASTGARMSRAGEVREFSCTDAQGRYAKKTIELVLPPGHGLTRSEVVGRFCDELGIVDRAVTIPDDAPTYKELQVIDSAGWGALQSYLAAINCVPAFDRDGVFVVRSVDKPADVDAFTFDAQQLKSPLNDAPSNDGPTTVEVRGSSQIVHDGDGLRTETTRIDFYETYSIKAAKFEYSTTAGTTTPSGLSDQPPIFQLVRVVITERTYEIDTLVFERVKTYGYRFKEGGAGSQVGGTNSTAYTYTVNMLLVEESGPATVDQYERFVETDRVDTTFDYDATTAFLTRVTTETFGWYQRRVAAADRSGSDWIYGTDAVLVSLDAVIDIGPPRDVFQLIAVDEETFTVVDGYVTEERYVTQQMLARPGHIRLYNGGFESQDDEEQIRTAQTKIVVYSAVGETSAVKITATYDVNGVTTQLVVEELESYLPAAKKRSAVKPDAALFPNGKAASRNESQELEFRVNSEKLEANRPTWTARISDQYIETIEEAESRGLFELARRSAVPYSFTVPSNALLAEGSQVTVALGPFGTTKLHVQRLSIEPQFDSGRLALVTVVEGVLYVV